MESKIDSKLILSLLKEGSGYKITVFDTVASTNDIAKRMSMSGADKAVIIASSQTNGRGRNGKIFFSPKDTGIYMSIALNKRILKSDISLLTSYTAIAVCLAIEKLFNVSPKIKWVNDVYLNNKKIAGILTETVYGEEKVVVGIGINAFTKKENFPEELQDIATSLVDYPFEKEKLIAELLNEFDILTGTKSRDVILSLYRNYSLMLSREILFKVNNVWHKGLVRAINDDINLIVESTDGIMYTLSSGEIKLM